MSTEPEIKQITMVELREATGLSERQLRSLARENHLPPPKNSKWPMVQTFQRYLAYKAGQAVVKSGALAAAKLSREQDKARQERVAADKAEESVIEISQGKRAASRYAATMMNRAMLLPQRLAQRLALETDLITIEQFLDKEMRGLFADLKFEYGLLPCPKCKKPINL